MKKEDISVGSILDDFGNMYLITRLTDERMEFQYIDKVERPTTGYRLQDLSNFINRSKLHACPKHASQLIPALRLR